MPRTKTATAQPNRRDVVSHSGTTARTGMPVTVSRPTASGTPRTRTGTVAANPPPHAEASSMNPSAGTTTAIAAQTRRI